jgi:Fe-S cluster biogenesis protein NfuA
MDGGASYRREGPLPASYDGRMADAKPTTGNTPAAPAESAPRSAEERIREIIEDIRPYLQHDGGDCEFVSYEDRVVNMRLHGACGSCPSSLWTLRMGIENAIREQVPEVESVRNVDQPDPAAGHPHGAHGPA